MYCIELYYLPLNATLLLFYRYSEAVSSWRRNPAVSLPSDASRLPSPSIGYLFVSVLDHCTTISFVIDLLYSCFTLLHLRTDNQSVERAPRLDDEIGIAGENDDADSLSANQNTALMDTHS
jgi:hypothetical protein